MEQKERAGKGILSRYLGNKRGDGHIKWVVLIVAFCMIMSCVLSYVVEISLIAGQKEIAKNLLDKQLSTNAVEIYQKIKEQSSYTDKEFRDLYVAELVAFCDLEAYGSTQFISTLPDGGTRYLISMPEIDYEEDFSPKLILTYTITVPIEFAGIQVVWVDVPIRIVSRFNPKYDLE